MSRTEQPGERLEKLKALRQRKIPPYGMPFNKTMPVQALAEDYGEGKMVVTAGRLTARRGHGGLVFADLRDFSGKIQICLRKEKIGEEGFKLFDLVDLGDHLGVSGTLFTTKTGEVTVLVEKLTVLSKALRPLPEKWHGLKDVAIRYRKRYLDLIANESARQVFVKRGQLLASLRKTLTDLGYLEVETPMMHSLPGGAAGAPFTTHHETLDLDLYMRLAPELHLKKLLVGGFDRVFEIGRCFRNEGLSSRHNPEFTMLEAYAAYGNDQSMMELVEQLINNAAKALIGSLKLDYQGKQLDLTPPWDRVSFAQTLSDLGLEPDAPLKKIQTVLQDKGIKVKDLNRSQLVRLVEQLFEPRTKTKPLFVVDYWTELTPLAKSQPDRPDICQRFELFIGGMEVANAYTELNDPQEQRRRFESQVKGKKDKQVDESFLEALEHGMPPAGGLGVGVDRLAMLLLDQPSIKDVILFPQLKPEKD